MSTGSNFDTVFKSSISLLIFFLYVVVSIAERGKLKYLRTLDFSISPLNPANFYFMYFDALLLGIFAFILVTPS